MVDMIDPNEAQAFGRMVKTPTAMKALGALSGAAAALFLSRYIGEHAVDAYGIMAASGAGFGYRFCMNAKNAVRLDTTGGKDGRTRSHQTAGRDARFAGPERLKEMSEVKTGIVVGKMSNDKNAPRLRHKLEAGAAIIAPPRAGKGNMLYTTMLGVDSWDGPIISLDPKLEGFMVCGPSRAEAGRDVILLDPSGLVENKIKHWQDDWPSCDRLAPLAKSRCYNVFDLVTKDERGLLVIDTIIGALVEEAKGDSDSGQFFSQNAHSLASVVAIFVCFAEPDESRHIPRCAELMALEQQDLCEVLMSRDDILDGYLTNRASAFVGIDERTFGGIKATVKNAFEWSLLPQMRRHLSSSDFDLEDILDNKLDIYIGAPDGQTRMFKPWYRLWATIPAILAEQIRKPKKRILISVDEFASYGRIEKIASGFTVLPGLGLSYLVITQDLHKVIAAYGKELTMSMMAAVELFMIFELVRNDPETAENISKMLGKVNYVQRTGSTNKGRSARAGELLGTGSSGDSESEQIVTDDLMRPDELVTMPAGTMIAMIRFRQGEKRPVMCQQVKYFECDEVAGLASPNPYFLAEQ